MQIEVNRQKDGWIERWTDGRLDCSMDWWVVLALHSCQDLPYAKEREKLFTKREILAHDILNLKTYLLFMD